MKKDIMEKWITALKSGEYKQTKFYLKAAKSKKSYGYCCLGVLCDLAIKDGVNIKVQKERDESNNFRYVFDSESGTLPTSVKKWADFYDYDFIKTLTEMNDNEGMNFRQIASVIRLYMSTEQKMKERAKLDLLQKLNSI